MGFNNGPRNSQTDTHTLIFGSYERIKDLLRVVQAWYIIHYFDQGLAFVDKIGLYRETRWPDVILHRLDPIRNKVDKDLLNLNRVNQDCRKFIIELKIDRNFSFVRVFTD